jgi:hypothetical protein
VHGEDDLGMMRLFEGQDGCMERSQDSLGWFSLCGELDSELAMRTASRVAAVYKQQGGCSAQELEHVQSLKVSPAGAGFSTSAYRLELLRRLCQIYSVDIKEREISSHRKVVGPCIVVIKKILFSLVKVLLGPTFKHQRDFNAVTVALLIDLCNDSKK